MHIREVKCKTCLTKSKITDYVINPYVGCSHGCRHCYAVFIRRFQNINDPWGEFCYAKINCPEILEKELAKVKPGHIWLSSVTDCYNPLEAKYKLTRQILEKIAKPSFREKFTVEILTRSSLVSRDLDLLKDLDVELGMSINNLDRKAVKILEPSASSPQERIETLKLAKSKGIRVHASISPVLPGITNFEKLFTELNFLDYVWIELLNTKSSVMARLMPVIKKDFLPVVPEFRFMFNNFDDYCRQINNEVNILSQKYHLSVRNIVVHNKFMS